MSLSDAGGVHRPDNEVRRPRVPSPPMFQFTVQGGVNHDGSARPDIEVAVVSLARYTFADPVTAMNGPALLEPPAERSRILPPTLGLGEEAARGVTGYDDDGLIADFTEDRCNRQLAHIARRLLLPDSYVEACYDLHQFLATRAVLETESVQRNVFKCLKICARLSKLPGYSIQLMWQVVQQAHQLIDMFTAERARTISLWLTKLTNRIRLMAVTPASDGSAPPRLPIVPPPELLHAQTREKLLPLPSMSVAALNDGAFNRTVGVSGAAHYLANPLTSATRLLTAGAISSPHPLPVPSPLQTISDVSDSHYTSTESDSGDVEVRLAPLPEEDSNLISTREAELAIIELQLRELENIPAHRMGPMVRAALNLLVEMRFRLQLGLPRQALAAENSGMSSSSEQPTTPSSTLGFLADGAGGLIRSSSGQGENDEIRIIDYVLDQISTSRRQQALIRATEGGSSGSSFGIPLFMMPQSHSGSYYSTDTSEYGDEGGRRQLARLPAPELRPSGIRRRRRHRSELDSESISVSDDESASEDETEMTEESESVTDNNTSAGDDSDQERRRRNHLRRRLFQI
ncbi:hypothetical protein IW146_000564 [Coemansia sp. RSA 922]|nr:hypothetical protein IW146_000564 [Coemansia sp. RSA 922]